MKMMRPVNVLLGLLGWAAADCEASAVFEASGSAAMVTGTR